MKTLLLIYVISVIISWVSLRDYEKKLGVREGILWIISLIPLYNTIIGIWYIIGKIKNKVKF